MGVTISLAELSQIWKPYTHKQWLRKRRQKYKFGLYLRQNPTPAEIRAWDLVRYAVNWKHLGFWFKRQWLVYGYYLDFYCEHLRLGVEIDGNVHLDHQIADKFRESNLRKHGVRLIRFTNTEVFSDPEFVCETIERECDERIKEFKALEVAQTVWRKT